MLINFTVGNFRSFKDKKTLNLQASRLRGKDANLIRKCDMRLLRSAVIYGANSSGKSNLIKAFAMMKNVITSSVRLNPTSELAYEPFLLAVGNENKPTYFEVEFIKGRIFRYGFEYDKTTILKEWLFERKSGANAEKEVFLRIKNDIRTYDFQEGEGLESKTNKNRLFLSLVAQLGGALSQEILGWFENFEILSGIVHKEYASDTKETLIDGGEKCDKIKSLLMKFSLGFNDITATRRDMIADDLPPRIWKSPKQKKNLLDFFYIEKFSTSHSRYDETGKIKDSLFFDPEVFESEGTKKMIDIIGPIVDALLDGKVLAIDELDAKLHPLLTKKIINIFNSNVENPNNAQLIFATHDTNLLSAELFRKDQIWFTEKNKMEQTDLYSLNNMVMPNGEKVRNDSSYEKNYIEGRYGAIPYFNSPMKVKKSK